MNKQQLIEKIEAMIDEETKAAIGEMSFRDFNKIPIREY